MPSGATALLLHFTLIHEHVATRRSMCRVSVPVLQNVYTKVAGASSSHIGAAAICLVSKLMNAESAECAGEAASSTTSLGMMRIWADAAATTASKDAIAMNLRIFILQPTCRACIPTDCNHKSLAFGTSHDCLGLAFLDSLNNHLSFDHLGRRYSCILDIDRKSGAFHIH